MPGTITAENVLDKIAELLIQNFNELVEATHITNLEEAQKFVTSDGKISFGRPDGSTVVLYQLDTDSDSLDVPLAESIATQFNGGNDADVVLASATLVIDYPTNDTPYKLHFPNMTSIGMIDANGDIDISEIVSPEADNPLNIGQFIGLSDTQIEIIPERAKEILDINIYELLSGEATRQAKINQFFQLWNELKGGFPSFDYDIDQDSIPDTWEEDVEGQQDNYSETHDIVEGGDYITRLDKHASGTINAGKTLQSLHRELTQYLTDVAKFVKSTASDGRPEYEPQSDGYLKLRSLNQGIIIRNQSGDNIGIEKPVLIPDGHQLYGRTGITHGPSYLVDGFTITIWVRFLDKVTTGTLFNYGSPFRSKDPKGFIVETFVLNASDTASSTETWYAESGGASGGVFKPGQESARFIRLVVRDHLDTTNQHYDSEGAVEAYNASAQEEEGSKGRLYDSHMANNTSKWGFSSNTDATPTGRPFVPEFGWTDFPNETADYVRGPDSYLLTHTQVPIDFTEWFFVSVNYNPYLVDDIDFAFNSGGTDYSTDEDYWRGNVKINGDYTHQSNLGNKCKVEIISKTDLLRARGYKV